MPNEKSDKQIIEELHAQINIHLDMCNGKLTPNLCKYRSSKEGRKKIIEAVTTRCVNTGVSVQQALIDFEVEFNPNFANFN